jgi:carbon storage regulator CsrA
MLVLARQEGDGITFPDLNLEVEVLRIQGRRVQLGVHAARDLTVLRSELLPEDSHPPGEACANSEKAMELQRRLRELSVLLATAKAQYERSDLEGVERTLRSIAARSTSPERSTHQVSEPVASYDCRSACQHLHAIHPDCPLQDATAVRGLEGLAC